MGPIGNPSALHPIPTLGLSKRGVCLCYENPCDLIGCDITDKELVAIGTTHRFCHNHFGLFVLMDRQSDHDVDIMWPMLFVRTEEAVMDSYWKKWGQRKNLPAQ